MTSSLSGKNFLVTGGSRGIGRAIVMALAESGASVGFSYSSNQAKAEELLAQLPGQNHFCVCAQVQSEADVLQFFAKAQEKWSGAIHGIVNNAGITKDGLILRMKTTDFSQVIDTNLTGTFLMCREAAKVMMKSKIAGSIVNITSVVGESGQAGQSNYAASKAGVEGLTKSLAQELAARGIRVNCVAPGFIGTEMTDKLSDSQKAQILDKIPLARMATPPEVAGSVLFLLSDAASYVTGHTLSVNGGLYM